MKIYKTIFIGRTTYEPGSDVPWYKVYPFFLIHMLLFGLSGFAMAYLPSHPPVFFLYMHGGFAVITYTILYLAIFGRDEVKWMFINAGLGLLGISSQIDWLLSFVGRKVGDYPVYVHVIPFMYYVLYTFLLRNAVLDIFQSRENDTKQKIVEYAYIAVSLAIYITSYYLERH